MTPHGGWLLISSKGLSHSTTGTHSGRWRLDNGLESSIRICKGRVPTDRINCTHVRSICGVILTGTTYRSSRSFYPSTVDCDHVAMSYGVVPRKQTTKRTNAVSKRQESRAALTWLSLRGPGRRWSDPGRRELNCSETAPAATGNVAV